MEENEILSPKLKSVIYTSKEINHIYLELDTSVRTEVTMANDDKAPLSSTRRKVPWSCKHVCLYWRDVNIKQPYSKTIKHLKDII